MPLFMDIHPELGDATPEDIAASHRRDLEVQDRYGVKYLTYWFNEAESRSFCLAEAPDAESARACHKEAHGLMPNNATLSKLRPTRSGKDKSFLPNWAVV